MNATNTVNLSAKTRRALKKYGMEACRTAYTANRIHGEGRTVCSYESGLHINSVDAAIFAWEEYQQYLKSCPRVFA